MTALSKDRAQAPLAELKTGPGVGLLLSISGSWAVGDRLPPAERFIEQLPQQAAGQLSFDSSGIERWDSRFVTWILRIIEASEARGIPVLQEGLPGGVRGLIGLSRAVNERTDTRRPDQAAGLLARIGRGVQAFVAQAGELLGFLGEVSIALSKVVLGRARFRASDLLLFVQQSGVEALPIISLISVLVGLILAFIGAMQLAKFGAQLYIADLVGIAMVREMGAMMAAVIMAGRTGAAFAAQLGTMQVNEEIDALRTLGIPPIEFLVLPRMLGLTLMMPLLCIYADLLGIVGGMLVGISLFDITLIQYMGQTLAAITLTDIYIGLFKSLVFGVLIAVAGCAKGIHSGRSSSAVGQATTSAVVMAIVAIIVADAVIALLTNALGI